MIVVKALVIASNTDAVKVMKSGVRTVRINMILMLITMILLLIKVKINSYNDNNIYGCVDNTDDNLY